MDLWLDNLTIAGLGHEIFRLSPGFAVQLDPINLFLRSLLVDLLRRIEGALQKREEWVLLGDEVIAEQRHRGRSLGIELDELGIVVQNVAQVRNVTFSVERRHEVHADAVCWYSTVCNV